LKKGFLIFGPYNRKILQTNVVPFYKYISSVNISYK
jgi:hypothetical protein